MSEKATIHGHYGSTSGDWRPVELDEDGGIQNAVLNDVFDNSTTAFKTTEQSPLNTSYLAIDVIDTTNVGAGPTYYPSSAGVSLDGYGDFSFTGKMIEGDVENNTLTLQLTNDEDYAGTGDWIDSRVFDLTTGTWVASYGCNNATTSMSAKIDDCNFSRFRFKFVGGASATNTIIVKARLKAI